MPKLSKQPIKTLAEAGDWLSTKEAALVMGCSDATISRLLSAGKLRSVKLIGLRKIEVASIRKLMSPDGIAA